MRFVFGENYNSCKMAKHPSKCIANIKVRFSAVSKFPGSYKFEINVDSHCQTKIDTIVGARRAGAAADVVVPPLRREP